MNFGLKKVLIGMAAGALGVTAVACGGDEAEATEAAPAGDEATTGGEGSCGAGSCGGAMEEGGDATGDEGTADDDEGGEASCGAGSCGGEGE